MSVGVTGISAAANQIVPTPANGRGPVRCRAVIGALLPIGRANRKRSTPASAVREDKKTKQVILEISNITLKKYGAECVCRFSVIRGKAVGIAEL